MKKSKTLIHAWAAEALASVELKAQDGLIHDLQLLRDTLAQAPNIRRSLSDTNTSIEARLDLVKRALGDFLSPPLRKLLETMLREHALEWLPGLVDHLTALRERHGVAREVTVMSAVPLEGDEREELRSALEKKWQTPVLLNEQLNPALIGGLQLRTHDWYFDASIQGRTTRLAQNLIGS